MSATTSLDRHATGRWAITTEASTYVVDLDQRTVVRRPVWTDAAELRRDGDAHPLLELVACVVGAPMRLSIDLGVADPGCAGTLRITTHVTGIDRLDD